ncbi:DUF1707 domain-containing protein [Actinomadura sp. WMMB 499]|uniref:DUF1707 SHOCT-like domain-containing protein n=1 Tax=Actinomadura sp. WMMB 499 TaxID=1219491 RepID=UPI0020C75EF8|nr:DUF1707 domain-containing protein [Actinomadura sp. WMMB 499]
MNLPENPSGQDPARLRASDADRDEVADRLREALAEGRITAEEHAERIDAAYRAKTYAELEPLLGDLPSASAGPRVNLRKQGEQVEPPTPQPANVVAVLSGATRSGRWLVEKRTNVVSLLGGVDLDFRQAVLSASEVTLNITAIMGGVSITVPPGVRVVDSTMAILGGTALPEDDVVEEGAPVIRLTGVVLLSGVSVDRREAGGTASRRDRLEERHQRVMDRHARRHRRLTERHRPRD